MVNIKKAIEFVKDKGDELEKNRLNSILLSSPASKSIQRKFREMQNSDGGFAYWTKEFSTVSDTVYMLSWLDDFQVHSGRIVDSAFDFLASNQQPDGGWDEVESMKNSTKSTGLTAGEEETRVFLTAYCAHWHVRFNRAKTLVDEKNPVEFLIPYRSPNGLILDDLQATYDSLVLFSHNPGKDSYLFAETIEVMEKKFSPDSGKGTNIAYLLCCLRDAGLEAYHPFVNLCIDELIQKQQEDGSWESEYGEKYATNATLEAIRVLMHYNVV
jgi:hypothetical protein